MLIPLTLCLPRTVSGQSAYGRRTDLQTWYGTSLKLNLKRGWAISGQYRLRIVDNVTTFRGSYWFAQVDKKLGEHLNLTANYRLALVANTGIYHRYALGLETQERLGSVQFLLRPMIQYQQQHFVGDDEGKTDTDAYFRPRLTAKYRMFRRLDTYLYAEPFFAVDHSSHLDWWQNSAGLKYLYSRNLKINLYYIWQPDSSHKRYYLTNHIVGLDVEFTIKS